MTGLPRRDFARGVAAILGATVARPVSACEGGNAPEQAKWFNSWPAYDSKAHLAIAQITYDTAQDIFKKNLPESSAFSAFDAHYKEIDDIAQTILTQFPKIIFKDIEQARARFRVLARGKEPDDLKAAEALCKKWATEPKAPLFAQIDHGCENATINFMQIGDRILGAVQGLRQKQLKTAAATPSCGAGPQ